MRGREGAEPVATTEREETLRGVLATVAPGTQLRDGLERILRAATHLMPDPSVPTEESGTRHRTAQRVARQTGFPVISVSQSMRIISLYAEGRRYVLDDSAAIL